MATSMQIPPMKIHFSASDRRKIVKKIDQCLSSGLVAQGQHVDAIEQFFCSYTHARHAMAVSSGGSALEAAMYALEVKEREVLVPTNTFLATAAGALSAGGTVKLLDIDSETLAPTPEMIEAAIGPRTAGIIVVHIGGMVTPDIERIRALCDQRGLWLFEDCAHAHGSTCRERKAGLFGIGGSFSFTSTKIITCGEGGMVISNDDAFAQKVKLLRNYGKPEPWVTYCAEFGLNWRFNELAAIVVMAQLERLDEFINQRERIAAMYTERLAEVPELRLVQPHGRSSWYKYIAVLPDRVDRARLKQRLKAEGVNLSGGVYDLPLHRQPVFTGSPAAAGTFPNADAFCKHHICLPIYFEMSEREVGYVVETLTSALRV